MSEGGDQEVSTSLLGDDEACKELNHEDLLSRVRSVFSGCHATFN